MSLNLKLIPSISVRSYPHFSVFPELLKRTDKIIIMDEDSYAAAVKLVSQTYVEQGRNAHRTQQNFIKELLEKVWESIFYVITRRS